ncbi:MAG: ClbS/DfsB family four-helix bundle protein [Bacilli bacterium]|nr:ClbS/DfsB family four-helix bundle protein [Bacilli bacterium]
MNNYAHELFQFDVTGKKEAHWVRDKNIRDILIHLYKWHQLFLQWIIVNETGECTPFLLEPCN